jgi:hypothetical protein
MLSLAKKVMAKYRTLLVKMALDNLANQQAKLNYERLCDLQVLLGLSCILPSLKSIHALIKFAQMKDVYVRDLVAVIKFKTTYESHKENFSFQIIYQKITQITYNSKLQLNLQKNVF